MNLELLAKLIHIFKQYGELRLDEFMRMFDERERLKVARFVRVENGYVKPERELREIMSLVFGDEYVEY